MSDDFDDLDNELLGLGDGDEGDDQHHHSDDRDKHSPPGDESEGAVSDSTVSSQQARRKKAAAAAADSPSPPAARKAVDISDDESDTPLDGRKATGSTRKRPSPGDDASSPPKKRAKAVKKPKRKRRGDNSDDDGPSVYSDGMDASAESDAVMSEPITSDDEMDDDDDDDVGPTLYPYQQYYKSAADKALVDSLPELEKETIIAERADELSKQEEARQMRARAREQKRQAEKQKKKEAKALLASATRRSMRGESTTKKNAESKKNAQLSELIKKRDEKNARKAGGAGDADKSKRRRRESPTRSEGEEDEDSDSQERPAWASQEKPSSSAKKGSEEAGIADIKLLIVGRSTIAKYWAHPGFEDATVGCFARVCIGNHPDTGKSVYRLCIIKGWQDSKSIYEVTGADQTIKFRRNAIIASADAERPTRVDVFSDSAPTEDEFRWWNGAMDVAKMKRPTVAFVEKKRQETKAVTMRQLSSEDWELIRLKKTSYYPDDPVLPHLDPHGLQRRRQQLVEQGDESGILKIDRELEWRAPPKALASLLNKQSQLNALGQINKRNREINRHDIRKAQLVEKKKNELAARHAAENGDSSFMDPFARVKTHARIYHDNGNAKKNSDKEAEANTDDLFGGGDDDKVTGNGSGAGLGKTDNKVPQVKTKKPKGVDDVIASMDLQFDIDFS
ncbi:hypothetical protein DRE_00173 [Drechslerella stenobrocha 248]|uniref:Plus3 domain-containing protein n=1 Tax=Drechslerella stenobrocha 248 TaxID=1043628 RepID=W7I965_9PEZI|nr:hypothetical protein DRE_00173 [Drechslerella stenobrocha 248]